MRAMPPSVRSISRLHGVSVTSKVVCGGISRGKSVTTTQIYTHVMARPGIGVRSPLDQ
jgi:hypothetical protein